MNQIQYISDDQNNVTGVIVPIDFWKEIESEKETAYLLNSEAMKKRLLEAKNRKEGIPLTKPVRSLEFDPAGFERSVAQIIHLIEMFRIYKL